MIFFNYIFIVVVPSVNGPLDNENILACCFSPTELDVDSKQWEDGGFKLEQIKRFPQTTYEKTTEQITGFALAESTVAFVLLWEIQFYLDRMSVIALCCYFPQCFYWFILTFVEYRNSDFLMECRLSAALS